MSTSAITLLPSTSMAILGRPCSREFVVSASLRLDLQLYWRSDEFKPGQPFLGVLVSQQINPNGSFLMNEMSNIDKVDLNSENACLKMVEAA